MNVIIHDLEKEQFEQLFPDIKEDVHIVHDNGTIRSCIGCFGCWIKTPGQCVIKDEYDNMGELLSQTEKVVIISRCYYGGYSPFVKNVLDRSISYLLPFFRTRNDETHHKQRYRNTFQLFAYFYGEHITKQEEDTARKLVNANCINFYARQHEVAFFRDLNDLCEDVKM